MALENKSEAEAADFWRKLQLEAETVDPAKPTASRDRLLELLRSYRVSYISYKSYTSSQPGADASQEMKEIFNGTAATLKAKMTEDGKKYKKKLIEFRFGEEVVSAVEDNTPSEIIPDSEMKSLMAAKKEIEKKKEAAGSSGNRFSPYSKKQHKGSATYASQGQDYYGYSTGQPSGTAMYRAEHQSPSVYSTHATGFQQAFVDPRFVDTRYAASIEERKRTTQCKECEVFGHWRNDGVCKPEDIQKARDRQAALNTPAAITYAPSGD